MSTKIRRGHKVTPIKANLSEQYVAVENKSKAGIRYVKYVVRLTGTSTPGLNRASRRSAIASQGKVVHKMNKKALNKQNKKIRKEQEKELKVEKLKAKQK